MELSLTRDKAINIVDGFLGSVLEEEIWYKNIKSHVEGILLYGSIAKGINRPDSDIDLLIIVPIEIEEKYTTGEYFFEYREQEINVVLRSIEKIRQIAKGKSDNFQKEVFRECYVFSASQELKGLLEDMVVI